MVDGRDGGEGVQVVAQVHRVFVFFILARVLHYLNQCRIHESHFFFSDVVHVLRIIKQRGWHRPRAQARVGQRQPEPCAGMPLSTRLCFACIYVLRVFQLRVSVLMFRG